MRSREQQLQYWTQQLEGSQPARLFYDKPYPAILSGQVGKESVSIEGLLYKNLLEFCKSQHTTPFVVLFATFRATHLRLTGAEDATIGTFIADGNLKAQEVSTTYSANLQCIRSTIQEESFEDLVQQVRATVVNTFDNRDIPYKTVAAELINSSQSSLVRMTFTVGFETDFDKWTSEGLSVERIASSKRAAFDLEFYLNKTDHGFYGGVYYSTDLFYPETIESLVSVFYEILIKGLEEPLTAITCLPLSGCLPTTDNLASLDTNRTNYPRKLSIVDLFRQQVAICPTTIAVKDASSLLTYAQLDRQSDQIALWLIERGLEPETAVGVLAPRSCQTIVALLGILKANMVYLPLDVNAPPGRIETILSSIEGHKLVLFGEDILQFNLHIPDIETVGLANLLNKQIQTNGMAQTKTCTELVGPSATSAAYIMFTSGSTGQPKGVITEHRNIVRLVMQANITMYVGIGTCIAHLANTAFDGSTFEIYTALLHGGTVICIDALTVLDTTQLDLIIQQENIRVAKFTPALLHQCLIKSPTMFKRLDILLVVGDRLDPRDARKILDWTEGRVFNAYGPTESTGHTTCYEIKRGEAFVNGVPIGRAIKNSNVHVMDSKQREIPVGVIGELVVTGDGLARGYACTKQNVDRFINVFVQGQSIRAYRTGDYVRRRPVDGELEFLGRLDHQVKIRGHRVELGEVEQVLLSSSLVSEAVALVRKENDLDEMLVGFVTLQSVKGSIKTDIAKAQSIGEQLRSYLQTRLPVHMVPSIIQVLDKMPINQNRKIDRTALTRYTIAPRAGQYSKNHMLTRNSTEQALCEEFSAILGVDVGVEDDFFHLGGHSLMATRAILRINRRLEISITVKDIFYYPTVKDLARIVEPLLGLVPFVTIPKLQHIGPVQQSLAQGPLWSFDQLYPSSTQLLWQTRWRLIGPLHLFALQLAFDALQRRHETLRTIFRQQNGVGVQLVQPFRSNPLRVIPIPQCDTESLHDVLEKEQEGHTGPFDLQNEPGWRIAVFRLSDQDHVLSIAIHHIIEDGWSLVILRKELGVFYSAVLHNLDPLRQVPELPIQYRDFAIWQRQQQQTIQHQRQLMYWVQQLRGSRPAELLCDKPRPSVLSGEAGEEGVIIDGPLYSDLQEFSKAQKVTLFVVLLSAFRATHFRLTGAEDATIGYPIANRNHQEVEGLMGLFANVQCIRSTIRNESFKDLVQQIRLTAATAFENQDIPFEQIVAELKIPIEDAVQLGFAMQTAEDLEQLRLEGLQVDPMACTHSTRHDIEFHIFQEGIGLRGYVLYSKDLFYPETIKNMIFIFYEVLKQGLENTNIPIALLPLNGCLSSTRDLGQV